VTKGNVSALTPKLTERQERLSAIEARLRLLKAAQDVFSLEVRRIEAGVASASTTCTTSSDATSKKPAR
jgi:hypothetical protein